MEPASRRAGGHHLEQSSAGIEGQFFHFGCGEASGNGVSTVETVWLTANEAAQYLKVKPRTLLLWARQRKIPAHRLSGIERCIYRFLKSELDGMLGLSSAGSAEGRQQ
jgi:excisionase family DNA binding protein